MNDREPEEKEDSTERINSANASQPRTEERVICAICLEPVPKVDGEGRGTVSRCVSC